MWLLLLILISGSQILRGEEGMWIPMLIEKYHIEDMQKAGLRLNAEDIYSINQDCLKDAIVIFGRRMYRRDDLRGGLAADQSPLRGGSHPVAQFGVSMII